MFFIIYFVVNRSIVYVYLNNLSTLKSFLNANSFSDFSRSVRTENELIGPKTFKYNDVFSAIINKTSVQEVKICCDRDAFANNILHYGLPHPFMFYNNQYIISLEELLKPTVCTDETIKQIETYIGFLNAFMSNNK